MLDAVNDCLSNPCENGGTCYDKVDGYTCVCQTGFIDDHCITGMYTTPLTLTKLIPPHQTHPNHKLIPQHQTLQPLSN